MISEKRSRLVLTPKEYKELCHRVMTRDGWKCRVCKRRQALHCHHIVFRSHGGDDAEWNLLTICNNCHDAVHNRFVIILPTGSDDRKADINANEVLRFIMAPGWTPGKATRRLKA